MVKQELTLHITKRPNKNKGKYSKAIVTMIIILNVTFATAVLTIFAKIGSEPSTLTGCWFAFTTGELWLLAGIKKQKSKGVEKIEHQQEIQ